MKRKQFILSYKNYLFKKDYSSTIKYNLNILKNIILVYTLNFKNISNANFNLETPLNVLQFKY